MSFLDLLGAAAIYQWIKSIHKKKGSFPPPDDIYSHQTNAYSDYYPSGTPHYDDLDYLDDDDLEDIEDIEDFDDIDCLDDYSDGSEWDDLDNL